ncbi:hypothetical protein ACOME3_010127 [Neoechinorhynchus agilis]
MRGTVQCIIVTCHKRDSWDRLVPLPKNRQIAKKWIEACWPYGIALDDDVKFLVCIDHFSDVDAMLLKDGLSSTGAPRIFGTCYRHDWTLKCNDDFVDLLMDINRDASDEMVSRTGALMMLVENEELSEAQKKCSHYLEDPNCDDLTHLDRGIGNVHLVREFGIKCQLTDVVKVEPWTTVGSLNANTRCSRFYGSNVMETARGIHSGQHEHYQYEPGVVQDYHHDHHFSSQQITPDHQLAMVHYDHEAIMKVVCKHGYFKDSCLLCSTECSTAARQQTVMNCSRPICGAKASIPFLEPAFREKIHNPFEGCTSLPALKPGAVRTREEGLETQLEASYRSILKKYYSNKWSRKVTGLKVAHRFDVSKIECCICGVFIPDNISLAGHFCAHLEDLINWTEEDIHLRLIDPNVTVMMSPDPYAAALNRTCAYCPTQPTFETPFEIGLSPKLGDQTLCWGGLRKETKSIRSICHCGMELPYRCETCGYRTSFYADMLFHYIRFHCGEDVFYCPFCLHAIELKPVYRLNPKTSSRSGSVKTINNSGNSIGVEATGGKDVSLTKAEIVLHLECNLAFEHIMLHFDRNEGAIKHSVSKYKFCRKCVLHLKAIKDHMKGDHLNIVAGAKASYMSSSEDEEYGVDNGLIYGGAPVIGEPLIPHLSRKTTVGQKRKADRRRISKSSHETKRLHNDHDDDDLVILSHQIKREAVFTPPLDIHDHQTTSLLGSDNTSGALRHSLKPRNAPPSEAMSKFGLGKHEDDSKDPSFFLPASKKHSPLPPRRSSRRSTAGRLSRYSANYSEFD